ncbi:DUF6236 family protein [Streptomyces sp. NBC_01445]|uniref:DUF6236 family protein n=1 Tax=Streptomyces sp. NBC_01445 TaxID=2903869 RepID=UPI002DDC282C|nr:DUF6236 family protein [Streptomyces sp. NBC_01445]WSE10025.1 DUF6236 family protein [Streptomyces sp. NBC_01445]
MGRIGLYFPYVHFRDDTWLKTTALYWPQIARVVSPDYPVHDGATVQALADGLDFLIPVNPKEAAQAIAARFIGVIHDNLDQLQRNFGVTPEEIDDAAGNNPEWRLVNRYVTSAELWRRRPEGTSLVEVHWGEIAPDLRQAMLDAGLGLNTWRPTLGSGSVEAPWMSMDPKLAWVYKLALTEELAKRNNLTPLTDQSGVQQTLHDWDSQRIAAALFDWHPHGVSPTSTLGILAAELPVPEAIAEAPVEKIVELRTRYASEFDRFTDLLTEAAADLREELLQVSDPGILSAHVRDMKRKRFDQPLRDLKAAIRGLKFGAGLGVMNVQAQLPAWAAIGGVAANMPYVTAGSLALGLVTLRQVTAQTRDQILADSPVSYLVRAEGLGPTSFVHRATGTLGRVSGIGT